MTTRSTERREIKQDRENSNLCVYCGKNPPKESRKGCIQCLENKVQTTVKFCKRNPERAKLYNKKVRKAALLKYGGICVCCGESEFLFLTIDHKNNDGHKERKEKSRQNASSSTAFFLELLRNEVREDLQVMCFNCNMGRASNIDNVCPHIKPSKDSYDIEEDLRFIPQDRIVYPSIEELTEEAKHNSVSELASKFNLKYAALKQKLIRERIPHYGKQSGWSTFD